MRASTNNNVPSSQSALMRFLVRRWVYRHPKAWSAVCFVAGTWLVILGTILCAYGFWWGAGLIAIGAFESWIGYRLQHTVPA